MSFQDEMKQIFLRVAAGEVFILLLQRKKRYTFCAAELISWK